MNNLKNPLVIGGAIIIAILIFAFYWFELRPTQIKQRCYKESAEWQDPCDPTILGDLCFKLNPIRYSACLHKNGL